MSAFNWMSGRVMQFAYTDIEQLKELQRKEEVSKDFKKKVSKDFTTSESVTNQRKSFYQLLIS